MPIVLCNRENCRFQVDQQCTCGRIGIVDLMCITWHRNPPKDNYRDMMRTDLPVARRREQVNSSKVMGLHK